MPLLLLPFLVGVLVAAPAAGVVGYAAGDGVSGASRVLKWAIIGGSVYALHRAGAFK